MSEPRRMLDDGAIGTALRSALVAEAVTTTTGDLADLHARILEGVASGAVPTLAAASAAAASAPASGVGVFSTLLGLSKASTGVAGLVLGAVLGAGGHALYVDTMPERAPIERVVIVERAAPPSASDVSLVPVDAAEGPSRAAAPGTPVVKPPSSSKPSPARVAAEAAPVDTPTAPTDALALELRAYERGEDALKNRRFDVALRELDAYLQTYPRGELVVEAELSRLEALLGLARGEVALSSSDRLRADKRFAAKRSTLSLFAIEALVQLGRCDEARSRKEAASLDTRGAAKADGLVAKCLSK